MVLRDVRGDFPILDRRIGDAPIVYLDSAATSLTPAPVIDAVTRFYTHYNANVHRAVHQLSEEATEAFEGTRTALARLLGADEDEIVFVRGATEGVNLVRSCLPGIGHVVTTIMEHHSNFLPWAYRDETRVVGVTPDGLLDMAELDSVLQGGFDSGLVAVTHVSNAIGTINPIGTIIRKAHDAGALVLIDAAQSVPHMPVDVKALDVDMLVISAHKMLGPGGVGVLYIKKKLLGELTPWHLGGNIVDQVHRDHFTLQPGPARIEAGTPAIEAVIGWGAAIDYLAALGLENVQQHDHALVEYALSRLADIRNVHIVGPTDATVRGVGVLFYIDGLEAHGVARMLSNRSNVLVRSGYHCAQPLHEALDVLPTVRASFYVYNTTQDIDELAKGLEAIVSLL